MMAKELTSEDIANKVTEIIGRLEGTIKRVNTSLVFLSEGDINKTCILTFSHPLWTIMLERKMLENYPELDLKKEEDSIIKTHFGYADAEMEGWVEIADPTPMYEGKAITFKVGEEEVSLNRDLLPIKLKKAEYQNIYYKLFTGEKTVMTVRKLFCINDDCFINAFRLFLMI